MLEDPLDGLVIEEVPDDGRKDGRQIVKGGYLLRLVERLTYFKYPG
jgi:hypothetical protein